MTLFSTRARSSLTTHSISLWIERQYQGWHHPKISNIPIWQPPLVIPFECLRFTHVDDSFWQLWWMKSTPLATLVDEIHSFGNSGGWLDHSFGNSLVGLGQSVIWWQASTLRLLFYLGYPAVCGAPSQTIGRSVGMKKTKNYQANLKMNSWQAQLYLASVRNILFHGFSPVGVDQ